MSFCKHATTTTELTRNFTQACPGLEPPVGGVHDAMDD